MTAPIKSSYPLGDMPARVLTGKVLMKAGADRHTLLMLGSLISELELDRKALRLTAAFPSMLWTGSQERDQTLRDTASDPERPVILFSILNRIADETEVKQVTRTWQEQKLASGTPTLLLGSIDRPSSAPARWLLRLREGRPRYSLLEKLFLAVLAAQLIGGLVWISMGGNSFKPRETSGRVETAAVTAVAPVPVVIQTPVPEPKPQPRPVLTPKPVPVVVFGDIVYYRDGKMTVHWKSAGKGFRYRIYVAKNADLRDSRLAYTGAIAQPRFTWTKTSAVDWLTVRVIDPSGRLGRFSEPVYVGL